jgi:hypothetical protein
MVPTLQRFADGSYQATVQLTNVGTGTAQGVQLSEATLGGAPGTTLPAAGFPFAVGNIAPNGSATAIVNFPASAGSSGARIVEHLLGVYNGGSFGGNLRVTLP